MHRALAVLILLLVASGCLGGAADPTESDEGTPYPSQVSGTTGTSWCPTEPLPVARRGSVPPESSEAIHFCVDPAGIDVEATFGFESTPAPGRRLEGSLWDPEGKLVASGEVTSNVPGFSVTIAAGDAKYGDWILQFNATNAAPQGTPANSWFVDIERA